MLSSCLVVAHLGDESLLDRMNRRYADLVRFYEPLGARAAEQPQLSVHSQLGLVAGQISLAADDPGGEPILSWGERLPATFSAAPDLIDAPDARLRTLDGALAAFAADGGRARLVTGTGCPTALYVARGDRCTAWSTHAVAAAWLALGEVRIDAEVVPELLSLEFVTSDRTLIRGAVAVSPGSCLDFAPAGFRDRTYCPPTDRWQPVPESEAYARAESELLQGLESRLGGRDLVHLGLTDGLDSRVVACAIGELGIPFATFTWGDPDWPDAAGARRIAEALGVPHEVIAPDYLDPDRILDEALVYARWTEGGVPVGFVVPAWPAGLSTFVTGTGAETGRAFYYRRWVDADPEADTAEVVRAFGQMTENRLRGARRETRRATRRRMERLVWDTAELGCRGWRCLDVLYGEQRVRRWARAYLPCLPAELVPAFATPGIMGALASLPLGDRLTDGFHRRFLAGRQPELVPVETSAGGPASRSGLRGARRAVPAPIRRLAGSRRARDSRGRWLLADRWPDYSTLRDWIADEALTSPLLQEPMGERWCAETRTGLQAGDATSTALALLAAAPVGLERELQALRSGG